ncbi:mediator of RNA polymerase II transcription subunit 1 isoform X2 [Jatropha curcas]|uniref:mediator of RNA polymerase II transcription subunit 1 isoform X2 n=1 Tax=Jatropha curcas TaxID=180498 RepID=UPI0005FB2874|nr:mediator of RNA polymerase II transcription subunit 1 isoform X2 [Jatropha curcas]
MERSEPTLVPEWLRSSGSVSGGGSSVHHFASSSSLSDVSSSAHHTRNRNSKGLTDFDSPRSAFLDRTSSSNSRRSSINGSAKHAYSSFSRSHRDKDRERDKERLNFVDHWDRDGPDPLGSILSSRSEKDTLRRSHSMVSRKQGEVLPRRFAVDLKNGSSGNHTNGNGLLSGGIVGSNIQKAVFEKDFPSLGCEERQGVPEIGRVSSPSLSTAVQNLPVGSSALIGGEGWTSALAEVPALIGNSSTGSLSSVQSVAASASACPSVMAGLNMAEALTQAPSRTRTAPQLSVQTQRLEELAIKQSRQLIPVTPSMPKSSVLNSSDKSKPKTVVRSGEMNMAAKSMQQQSSALHPTNQSLGIHVKTDAPKTSHGKLFVLKPGWENGVSPSPKDIASPTNNVSRAANSQLAAPASVTSVPLRSPNNAKLSSSGERKSANSNMISAFNVEKRPLSQTQSRNDFFNLLKKKTSNSSPALPDSSSVVSSPTSEKSCEVNKEVVSAPTSPQAIKDGAELTSNGGTHEEVQRFSEEEAAFLRSLGWEENSGEDEGLTEEEINAFYQEYMKKKPSLKVCRGVQQKLLESHATVLGGASSELISSDSGSET